MIYFKEGKLNDYKQDCMIYFKIGKEIMSREAWVNYTGNGIFIHLFYIVQFRPGRLLQYSPGRTKKINETDTKTPMWLELPLIFQP